MNNTGYPSHDLQSTNSCAGVIARLRWVEDEDYFISIDSALDHVRGLG